jgi:hypothetical protein
MTVYLTLISAGADTGPFDLYSNLDSYTTPFETGVLKTTLQVGYFAEVPDNTTTVRIKSTGDCINYVDILLRDVVCEPFSGVAESTTTTTTTTAAPTTTTTTTVLIACSETAASGGVGITDYYISLDEPLGGPIAIQFDPQGVPDKLELIHNGIKVATTAFLPGLNAGPFDNVYGTEPTNVIPVPLDVAAIDQFIGTAKAVAPTREAEFQSETGMSNTLEVPYQQWIWWVYDASDYTASSIVQIRVTGSTGTSWSFKRSCPVSPTTTTTTTV